MLGMEHVKSKILVFMIVFSLKMDKYIPNTSLLLFLSRFAVVPHITDAIQEWVMRQARIPVDDDGIEPQVCVIEVGIHDLLHWLKAEC